MGRAPCCDKTKVKRGPWSPEEDEVLKKYIQQNGNPGNWIALPAKAGLKRCGKSCRLRWLNYLRPDIKHGGFTEEEDRVIYALYSQIGSRWSVIAGVLHGRTDNDVKNHWNTKLKKRLILSPKVTNFISINNEGNHIVVSTDHDTLPPLMMSNSPEDYTFISSTSAFLYQLAPSNARNLLHDQMNFVPRPGLNNEVSRFGGSAASNFPSPEVASVSSSSCMAALDDQKYPVPWPSYNIEGEEHDRALIQMSDFGNPYDGLWSLEKVVGEADCDSAYNLGELLSDEIDIKPEPDQGLIQGGINQY